MYPTLKPLIKELMKQKGLSYKELGRRIGISESGVKKLFQAEDCSVSRLEQISRVLEVDMPTLLKLAQEETAPEQIEICAKAQATLMRKPLLMDIYWLLFVEDLSPAEILARFKISKSSLYKCLNELDRLKLIVWKADDNVTASPKRPFVVSADGPLIQYWTRRFSESILEDAHLEADNQTMREKAPYVAQRFLHLKPESARELRQRLDDLIREFTLRSSREKTLGKNRTSGMRVFVSYAAGSMVKTLR